MSIYYKYAPDGSKIVVLSYVGNCVYWYTNEDLSFLSFLYFGPASYFPEYAKYFGRALRLLNSMYGMNNSGKLYANELTEWLLEADSI